MCQLCDLDRHRPGINYSEFGINCRLLLVHYRWYVGDMSRQRAESLLKQGDKEGCFVVRKSSTKGLYTLSLHTKV